MYKLGTIVTDKATKMRGMLTIMLINMEHGVHYRFQPSGLNPDTGETLASMWLTEGRVEDGVKVPTPALPLHVLGTNAIDTATGFGGMVTDVCLHDSGCVHLTVQPAGRKKDGSAIASEGFNYHRLSGPAFKEEREADKREKPSPNSCPVFSPV